MGRFPTSERERERSRVSVRLDVEDAKKPNSCSLARSSVIEMLTFFAEEGLNRGDCPVGTN